MESSTTGVGTAWVVTAAGRGAATSGRRRISDQMKSPAAISTPPAMRRVGSEVVDVVIAGGTAGTGVTVVVGVGEAVGEGVSVGVTEGVGVADTVGVGSGASEPVGVGVAPPESVGSGVGSGDSVGSSGTAADSAPPELVVAPSAAEGTESIRLPIAITAPAKPSMSRCDFGPRIGVGCSLRGGFQSHATHFRRAPGRTHSARRSASPARADMERPGIVDPGPLRRST